MSTLRELGLLRKALSIQGKKMGRASLPPKLCALLLVAITD